MADKLHASLTTGDGIHAMHAWDVATLSGIASATLADVGKVARVVRPGSTEYVSGVVQLESTTLGAPVDQNAYPPGSELSFYPFSADGAVAFTVVEVLASEDANVTLRLRVQCTQPGDVNRVFPGENELAPPRPPGFSSRLVVLDDGVILGSARYYVLHDIGDGGPEWRVIETSDPNAPAAPTPEPGITVEHHAALGDVDLHGIVRWTVAARADLATLETAPYDVGKVAMVTGDTSVHVLASSGPNVFVCLSDGLTSTQHAALTGASLHGVFRWTLVDSGYLAETVVTAADVGKVALCGATGVYVLTSASPKTWVRLSDASADVLTLAAAATLDTAGVTTYRFASSTPATLTLPAGTIDVGASIRVVQMGASQATIEPAAGVTLLPGPVRTRVRGSEIVLRKVSSTAWDAVGDFTRGGLDVTWANFDEVWLRPTQNSVGLVYSGAGAVQQQGTTARSCSPSTYMARRTRVGYVSAATAGSYARCIATTQILSNDGLHASFTWGVGNPSTAWRWFVGMANAFGTNLAANVPTYAYTFGAAKVDGSSNVCIVGTHSTVPARVQDLGASFPASTVGACYQLEIDVDKTGTWWRWELNRLDVAARATGVVQGGVDAPAASLGMQPTLICNNVTDAVAVELTMMSMGTLQPYRPV